MPPKRPRSLAQRRKHAAWKGGAPDDFEEPPPPPLEIGRVVSSGEVQRISNEHEAVAALQPPRRREERPRRTRERAAEPPPVLLQPGPPPRPDAAPPPPPPQVPAGVELIQREMETLVRAITEGVRRTVGDVSDAGRVTEINEHLVRFVSGVMQALAKLLEHLETYNRQMTELMRELNTFNNQINGRATASRTEQAARDAVARLSDFRTLVSKSLDGMKKYLRPEDMVHLQQALSGWEGMLKAAPAQKENRDQQKK